MGWRLRVAVMGLVPGISAWAAGGGAPTARTARLSYLSGVVTAERSDNTGRGAAVLNMPLPEGTRILTAGDGQAEIEFEDGSVVRETPNSALTLTTLGLDSSGNYLTRVDVLHGLVYAELRAAARYQYLVAAGGDAISPKTNAAVRIQFDQPPGVISVMSGSVQVANGIEGDGVSAGGTGSGFQTELKPGESLRDDPDLPGRYRLDATIGKESWDSWNEDRDQAAANEATARTAARDGFAGDQGYGWSDLDANGSWYDVPDQGQVWQPSVAASSSAFDPYGYGNWVWYPTSGYVWSSGYSWGWTPFQCGSWNYFNSFGWGWSPGATCGIGGWRLGGGRFAVNIAQGPVNYRPPKPPVPGPVKVHPVVPVNLGGLHDGSISPGSIHDGSLSGTLRDGLIADQSAYGGLAGSGFVGSVRSVSGTRTIGGKTIYALRPVGNGDAVGGGAVIGSALRRDFSVEQASRKPILGVQSEPVSAGSREAAGAIGPGFNMDVPSRRRPEWVRGGETGMTPMPMRMPPPPPLVRSAPAAPARSMAPPAAAHPAAPIPVAHPAAGGAHR